MNDGTLSQQLIDRINVLFMRHFDNDCRYSHFGAFESSAKALRLTRKLGLIQQSMGQSTTKRTLHKLNRSTPLLRSVMREGGCIDPKTRALINRNNSEAEPSSPKQPVRRTIPVEARMDDWKRVALYHVALKRNPKLSPSFSEEALAQTGATGGPLSGSKSSTKLPSVKSAAKLGI